jgi:hypothetical protein
MVRSGELIVNGWPNLWFETLRLIDQVGARRGGDPGSPGVPHARRCARRPAEMDQRLGPRLLRRRQAYEPADAGYGERRGLGIRPEARTAARTKACARNVRRRELSGLPPKCNARSDNCVLRICARKPNARRTTAQIGSNRQLGVLDSANFTTTTGTGFSASRSAWAEATAFDFIVSLPELSALPSRSSVSKPCGSP